MQVIETRQPVQRGEVYDTFWRFAAERQSMFEKRRKGLPPPWTEDEILAGHRFTNCYRASDRVSQYLIRNVLYRGDVSDPREVIFRSILFRMFNLIDTWEAFGRELGGPPSLSSFRRESYGDFLTELLDRTKCPIWGNAYMVCGVHAYGYKEKHRNWLAILRTMRHDGTLDALPDVKSLAELYATLHKYPLVGEFVALQWAIDLNYSSVYNFDEDDWIVAGLGAVRGLRKVFVNSEKFDPAYLIRWMTERQDEEFARLGLRFDRLGGVRPLKLIDIQNLCCEVDKYTREMYPMLRGDGPVRIKQRFDSALAARRTPISYMYPPRWGIKEG